MVSDRWLEVSKLYLMDSIRWFCLCHTHRLPIEAGGRDRIRGKGVTLQKSTSHLTNEQQPATSHESLLLYLISFSLCGTGEHQRKLNSLWQSRGGATPNIPLSVDVLRLFLQHARTIHYCLTPLLFLPRWRVDSAATRDHSLSVSPPSMSPPRGTPRTTPRGTPAKERRGSSASVGGQSHERWHAALCAHFVHQYQQYLQTLGFIPVQVERPAERERGAERGRQSGLGVGGVGGVSLGGLGNGQSHFLQKSLLGGVLMVELVLAEPFFHSRLHALECSRMQTKSPAFISQFTVSFLDECDKVKVLLHLHSFAYDYHLRCLHGCVTSPANGGQGGGPRAGLLPPGYHLTLFLDDFLKYYSKAPNFARNLVHADTVTVTDIATPGLQLFSYLLANDKAYGMAVFRMAPVAYDDAEHGGPGDYAYTELGQSEFVLVQHKTTPHLSYRDVHDLKQTDDFDVTLIVAHEAGAGAASSTDLAVAGQSQLCLKYFIVLTSRRELYPKAEVERKQGKFRTVSTAHVPGPAGPPSAGGAACTPPLGPPPAPPQPPPAPSAEAVPTAVPLVVPVVVPVAVAVPVAPPIITAFSDSTPLQSVSASPSAPSTPGSFEWSGCGISRLVRF